MLPDLSADRLFDIFRSQAFLEMRGLSGEVPLFIQTYDPAREETVTRIISTLVSRLKGEGIHAASVDLFELVIHPLEKSGKLVRILQKEATLGKKKMLELLSSNADSKKLIVPALVEAMSQPDVRLTLIRGVGTVFPFLRTHSVLEAIQPALLPHPVILFFPGEYTQVAGLGSQLRLFGQLPAKRYYRAFNLDHYKLATA